MKNNTNSAEQIVPLDSLVDLLKEAYDCGYSSGYDAGKVDCGKVSSLQDTVCPWDDAYSRERILRIFKQANIPHDSCGN
jgi:hypothetical protein